VPFLPISGWIGDNLIKPSENMKWWKPVSIKSLSGKKENVRRAALPVGLCWWPRAMSCLCACPFMHAHA
jgi:translation elongation factor EF-1alpha